MRDSRERNQQVYYALAWGWAETHPSLLPDVEVSHIADSLYQRLMTVEGQQGSTTILRENGEAVLGAIIEESAWDSSILGLKVAKLMVYAAPMSAASASASVVDNAYAASVQSLLRRLLPLADAYCYSHGYRLAIARVDCRDLLVVQILEDAGFRTTDTIVTFWARSRPANISPHEGMITRPHKQADISEICRIAGDAFRLDHFHQDTRIAPVLSRRIYEEWALNSCLGRANAVLVCEADSRILGFITCIEDKCFAADHVHGVIDLVAVDPGGQRRGVGKQLVAAALSWFAERGISTVTVGTQTANLPAVQLYQSCGFRACGFSYTLHKWL